MTATVRTMGVGWGGGATPSCGDSEVKLLCFSIDLLYIECLIIITIFY